MPRSTLRTLALAAVLVSLSAPAPAQATRIGPLRPAEPDTPSGTTPCFWETRTPAPAPRFEPGAAVVDGQLFLFGGFTDVSLHATPRVDVYDPEADSWSQRGDMPVLLTHAGIARDDREIWFAGGFVGHNPGAATATVRIYDVDADAWSLGPSLPGARAGGALVRHERELHYFGGVLADRNTNSASHWVLDLDAPSAWSSAAPLPGPRNHLSGIGSDGRIYAIGGQEGHDVNPVDVDRVDVYDPGSGSWSDAAPLPLARSHAEPGTFRLGSWIVVAGGKSTAIGAADLVDVTAYDPLDDRWFALPSLPEGLLAPAVKRVGDRIVLACGGDELVPLAAVRVREAAAVSSGDQRLNSGGGAYPDSIGATWCRDLAYVGGQSFSNPAVGDIAGTDEDPLYRSERSGDSQNPTTFRYRLPVVDGNYRVHLHFAEIYWGAPGGGPGGAGQRVFDVFLEGGIVLDDFDVFAEVGAATATVRWFDTLVVDGAVDLVFVSSVDRPKVSAIRIERLP